ncbi:hypothetical protein PAXRUDRAFT_827489 [Paxillus rubicundulus Ve08.2h10]|uniref:Uncharacterized protein n=1 Tax=Paxillus rubicundulus Ve08.2h10 TaxID=930991 RepID=A0A0D0DXV1_9AGAM|nr:hypothetical protein PAXRUDRAFT_827489 [Paxillus rubicundulus Ve08.2h10]
MHELRDLLYFIHAHPAPLPEPTRCACAYLLNLYSMGVPVVDLACAFILSPSGCPPLRELWHHYGWMYFGPIEVKHISTLPESSANLVHQCPC